MKAVSLMIALVLGAATMSYAQTAPVADASKAPQPKMIFDFQKDLGLTDKQVTDMKTLMADLQKTLGAKSQEMQAMRQALAQMIQNKEDMKEIRKQLQKIADFQVDNSCFDIDTSRKVEGIMTPEQITKWKDIQAKSRQEAEAKAAPVADKK